MKLRATTGILTVLVLVFAGASFAYPTEYQSGLTIMKPGLWPGFALFRAQDSRVHLVAPNGKEVHTWVSPDPESGLGYARPLENGNILVHLRSEPFPGCGFNCGTVMVLDWNSNPLWEYTDLERHLHHDFELLPNGNTLMLCSKDFVDPDISPLEITDDCLIEVDPDGNVVWEWQTADHFEEFEFSDEAKALISEAGGDWAHANAAHSIQENTPHDDPRFTPGNIIISYRQTNFIIIVDRLTEEIVWKTDELTLGQHNTHMLTNDLEGAGNILVFDNGGEAGYPTVARLDSQVHEIDPLTMEHAWTYKATDSGMPLWSFFGHFVSSAQRLPNGNTFIDEGPNGRLFEVTRDGEIVWEFVAPKIYGQLPDGSPTPHIYRAHKVSLDWPPVEIPPSEIGLPIPASE